MLGKERMYTFNEYSSGSTSIVSFFCLYLYDLLPLCLLLLPSVVAEHRDVGHGVMSINYNFIDIYGDKGEN